jgi:DNA replication protein DnaC
MGDEADQLEDKVITVTVVACDCEEKALAEEDRKATISLNKHNANFPKIYSSDNMKDWIKVPGTEELIDVAKRYLDFAAQCRDEGNLKIIDGGKGVLFAGHVGTGKTKVISYIGRRLIEILAVSVVFIRYSEMLVMLESCSKNQADLYKFMKGLITADVLIVDDLADTEVESWRKRHVVHIFNSRWERRRPVFITTMKNDRELCTRLEPQIVSRIYQMCEDYICEVSSKVDMRLKGNREKYATI